MKSPQVGEKVWFVLSGGPHQGELRTAEVTGAWADTPSDIYKLAIRERTSTDEVIARHGMRASLLIHTLPGDLPGLPCPHVVQNAEHSPVSQSRRGTWHRPDDISVEP